MNDYNIIIKIGAFGMNEDEALDQYSHVLFFIQENLPMENYMIEVEKVGEYIG